MLWKTYDSMNTNMQLRAPWCYMIGTGMRHELQENGVSGQRAPEALYGTLVLSLELLPTGFEVEASVPSGAFPIGSDIKN